VTHCDAVIIAIVLDLEKHEEILRQHVNIYDDKLVSINLSNKGLGELLSSWLRVCLCHSVLCDNVQHGLHRMLSRCPQSRKVSGHGPEIPSDWTEFQGHDLSLL
jgi:hypothetical protein